VVNLNGAEFCSFCMMCKLKYVLKLLPHEVGPVLEPWRRSQPFMIRFGLGRGTFECSTDGNC